MICARAAAVLPSVAGGPRSGFIGGVSADLTALKAKRARAAAGLRTSAAHARWEEIDLSDVAPVIELTKELIGARLLGLRRRGPPVVRSKASAPIRRALWARGEHQISSPH